MSDDVLFIWNFIEVYLQEGGAVKFEEERENESCPAEQNQVRFEFFDL